MHIHAHTRLKAHPYIHTERFLYLSLYLFRFFFLSYSVTQQHGGIGVLFFASLLIASEVFDYSARDDDVFAPLGMLACVCVCVWDLRMLTYACDTLR